MQAVGAKVAGAVNNALNSEPPKPYQHQLARDRDRLRVLLEVNNILVTSRELPELFLGIVATLERVIHHDYTSLALFDPATGLLKIHALDFPGGQNLIGPEATVPLDASPAGRCFTSGQPAIFRGAELDRFPLEILRILRPEGVETVC